MKMRVLAVMAASILGACAGEQGAPGGDGRSTVLRTSPEPSGAHCATGGLRVDSGVDDDADGLLDEAEIDGTAYVCAGADGTSVTPAPEDPGELPRGRAGSGRLPRSFSSAALTSAAEPNRTTRLSAANWETNPSV